MIMVKEYSMFHDFKKKNYLIYSLLIYIKADQEFKFLYLSFLYMLKYLLLNLKIIINNLHMEHRDLQLILL